MTTQPCLIGVRDWSVDAITRIPIYVTYAYRPGMEGKVVNVGAVTVDLFPDATSTTFYALVSGESIEFKAGEIRGTLRAGGWSGAPICHAKAESGTSTLRVLET